MSAKKAFRSAQISRKARQLGAELVGFAPVERWSEQGDLPPDFHPQNLWPQAKTVIAIAVPVWLPILETSPSTLNLEQYHITNALLDHIAYRLAAELNRRGHAAINISRDGYGHIDVLRERPAAAFSHVWAAHYAGIGRIGANRTLLTLDFGPRVRLVSVLTALELPGTPLLTQELCIRCGHCLAICPARSFSPVDGELRYAMDKLSCAENSKRLRVAFRNPCGFCVKVCPVGADRELFAGRDWSTYRQEAAALAQNPQHPDYRAWQHVRRFGGWPLSGETQPVEGDSQ